MGVKDNGKTYKYYLFYLNKDNSLYAYTDSKELAESFMSQRNHDKIHMKKMNITKDDVNYLARHEQNKILIENTYLAFIRNKNMKIYFKWTVTVSEDLMVNSLISQATINIYNNAWYPIEIFNKDVREALIHLGYDVCNRYIGVNGWNSNYKSNKYAGYIEKDIVKYLNTSQSDEDDAITIDESYILFQTISRTV